MATRRRDYVSAATPSGEAELTFGGLQLERATEAADWIVSTLASGSDELRSLLPPTFENYARILHPAYRLADDTPVDSDEELPKVVGDSPGKVLWRTEVRWSRIAARNQRVAHRCMQWPGITGSWRYLDGGTQPGLWDVRPVEGSLPERQLQTLVELLTTRSEVDKRCFFAVWEGYEGLPVPRRFPKIRLPRDRALFLLSGTLGDAGHDFRGIGYINQSANLWWPADHAWCVVSDVDLMSTYVGGTAACIDTILGSDRLEAVPAQLNDDITFHGDDINPPPADSPDQ